MPNYDYYSLVVVVTYDASIRVTEVPRKPGAWAGAIIEGPITYFWVCPKALTPPPPWATVDIMTRTQKLWELWERGVGNVGPLSGNVGGLGVRSILRGESALANISLKSTHQASLLACTEFDFGFRTLPARFYPDLVTVSNFEDLFPSALSG